LVSIIGGEELARQGQHIRANTFEIVPTFVWVGIFYLIITVTLSRVADYYEKKLEARE
jgi:ABC-type amino acid transport system permease subunit